MKKIFLSFTFWFAILSLLIIANNYTGYDSKNIILIGLNPILQTIVYIEPYRTWLLYDGIPLNRNWFLGDGFTLNMYIAHLLTFLFYGVVLDLIKLVFKKLFKQLV